MPALTMQFAKTSIDDMYEVIWDAEAYDKLKPVASELFADVKKPDGAYYQTTSLIGMGKLKATSETDGYQFGSPVEGYTVLAKPKDYTDGIDFTYDSIKDNAKIGNILKETAAGWGGSKKQTIEQFYTDFFNYGGYLAGKDIFNGTVNGVVTDASGDLGYDSYPFFALSGNNHVSKKNGTYYNADTLSLTAANAETAFNLMSVTNSYDEKDEKITLKPDIMWYHPSLEFAVRRILESTSVPGKTDNDKNVLQSIVEPVCLPLLNTSIMWGYGVRKKGLRKIMWQDMTVDFYDDKDNRCWKAVCEMRLLGCMNNWRFWTANNAPTA